MEKAHRSIYKGCAVVLLALLILSLVPLLWIAFYNSPCADDFNYGLSTAMTWNGTHSFTQVLSAALNHTMETYRTWQGSFSAVFLMTLQPAVFGTQHYWLGTALILASFLFSHLFFFKVLLRNCLSASRAEWLVLACTLTFAAIQFTYAPVESFFWYNGSVYYTFFYCVSLFWAGILLLIWKEKKPLRRTLLSLAAALLSFFLGGGNYTTALLCTLLLLFACLWQLWKKDRAALWSLPIFLCLAASFLLSILAPGNAVRQAAVGGAHSPLTSIALSFVYGAYSIANATTLPAVILWLFLLPLLFQLARRSPFSFRLPVPVLLLFFCFYCAQATPPLYALGVSLPERLIDIIYHSYWIFTCACLFYLLGWCARRLDAERLDAAAGWLWRNRTMLLLTAVLLFGAATVGRCTVQKGADGGVELHALPTSAEAALSLLRGEAQTYGREAAQRELLYLDPEVTDVEVPPFTVQPYLLFQNDITRDPDDWRNRAVADYYQKSSVRLTG